MSEWASVETAPTDGKTKVLLGWWNEWPELKFEQEVGVYGQMEGRRGTNWLHGKATHWMPLPEPPK